MTKPGSEIEGTRLVQHLVILNLPDIRSLPKKNIVPVARTTYGGIASFVELRVRGQNNPPGESIVTKRK